MLDIGRPDRFWHAVTYWNVHSPLWEVTMCVTLYLMVLSLEVLPTIGHSDMLQSRWPRLSGKMTSLHMLAPVLAVVGLGLSLLHQSSLGATFGVLIARPIWYRPGLAALFIVSAMAAGPAFIVLASKTAAAITPRARVNHQVLDKISMFIGWVLVVYLYLRFWDTLSMSYTYEPARTEALQLLTRGPLALNFWGGEIILGIVVPMIILMSRRLRSEPRLHLTALVLIVGGLVAYRWDVNMAGQMVVVGYIPQGVIPFFTQYTPSLIEIVAGAGIVAFGLLAFTLGVRYFNIVDHGAPTPEPEEIELPAGVMPASVVAGD
jgi:Ni/Fe-hydrogenase subunit HybB-like protein